MHKRATKSIVAAKLDRAKNLKHYLGLESAKRQQEKDLHAALHADIEHVVARKRILLFKSMLEDADHDPVPAGGDITPCAPAVYQRVVVLVVA